MNIKNITIDDNDILNDFFENYLLNKENFLIFEETFIPTLPNPKVSRIRFNSLRKDFASGVKKPEVMSKINRLNDLNKTNLLQDQTNKLIKIDNNNFTLRETVDDLKRIIENNEKSLELKIEHLDEDLTNYINELLNVLNEINNNINNINMQLNNLDDILNKLNDILNKLDNLKSNINNNVSVFFDDLNKNLNELFTNLKLDLDNKINELKENLRQYIFNELTEQTADIIGGISGVLTTQLTEQTTTLLTDINADLGVLGYELNIKLNNLSELINKNKTEIITKIDNFIEKKLKNKIIEGIKEWYKENCKDLFSNISNYICERIVGESYIKYDACNLYMPTLMFKFKTDGIFDKRKYSQLKLRLNYKTNKITDELVNKLKLKIKSISNINYTYGGFKGVYVGENRLFKTTIFSINKDEIINLLNKLIPLTNTNFVKENISYIENSKRHHNLRRVLPLTNIKINNQIDKIPQKICLSAVYLQVNGLERQIKLY